jgi:hypothetical protein
MNGDSINKNLPRMTAYQIKKEKRRLIKEQKRQRGEAIHKKNLNQL